jgi:hypothetical protein
MINLIIEQDPTFGRQIVQGIIAYVRKHPHWRIAMQHAIPYIPHRRSTASRPLAQVAPVT